MYWQIWLALGVGLVGGAAIALAVTGAIRRDLGHKLAPVVDDLQRQVAQQREVIRSKDANIAQAKKAGEEFRVQRDRLQNRLDRLLAPIDKAARMRRDAAAREASQVRPKKVKPPKPSRKERRAAAGYVDIPWWRR